MPVVTFRISAADATDARCQQLLLQGSALYAELLRSPIERIRAFVQVYEAGRMAVGGQITDPATAFFECYVLAGRSQQQRHAVLSAFTELLADTLEIDTASIRGTCIPVAPDDWSIGGRPAGMLRAEEIAARHSRV